MIPSWKYVYCDWFLAEYYKKHVILRDFNMEPSEILLAEFVYVNSYYNFIIKSFTLRKKRAVLI